MVIATATGGGVSALDLVVIGLYLSAVWGIGLFAAYRNRRRDGEFLLGRRFGWFSIGSSIFATNITPSFLIASASAAYATGMATANYEWLAWIFLFLLGFVFAPQYLRLRVTTMPEFIRQRFGNFAADFLSWYGLLIVVILWVGGDLFVGGKLLSQMLGAEEWKCMVALAVVFTSFTVAGGFAAVMATDTLQSVMMVAAMLTLNAIALSHVGGVDALLAGVPADHWALFRPAGDASYPWPAIVLGYPVLGLWFWCTDQTIVQRMLGARDLRAAQYGTLYTAFLKILPPFLFMMPGLFCLVLLPRLEDPDRAFWTMVTRYMPNGMIGLMISVLFAAAVAGVSGGLNAFSTIFTLDIYRRKLRPNATESELKRVSRWAIVAVAIGSMFAALFLQGSRKNIFDTLQGIIAFFAPPMASVFLLSVCSRRVTRPAVNATLCVGSAVSLSIGVMVFRDFPAPNFWPHFMLLTFYLFSFCCVLLVGVSFFTQPPNEPAAELPARSGEASGDPALELRSAGAPGWILWGVLTVIMLLLYVGFQRLAARPAVPAPTSVSAPR